MRSLFEFEGDIFLQEALAAITRNGSTVTITVMGGTQFDYDFDTDELAAKAVLRAIDALRI